MIFYFHGFSSGENSHKANVISRYFENHTVIVPEYPSHQPVCAVEFLRQTIDEKLLTNKDRKLMLIGSSLGGYYAQYLATQIEQVAAVVLINPCLEPEKSLALQIGKQNNCVTGKQFEFTADDYNQLKNYSVNSEDLFNPTMVLLDEGDEVIDYRVAEEIYRAKESVIVYPGGDHWFRHLDQALPKIEDFYQSEVNG